MASLLDTIKASVEFSANIKGGGGLAGTVKRTAKTLFTFGNGAGQCNGVVSKDLTIATGTPNDTDLTSLVDPAGAALVASKLLGYIAVNLSTTAGEDLTLGGGANPIMSALTLATPAKGGFDAKLAPDGGWTVDGTHKIFRVSAASGIAVPAGLWLFVRV